MKWIHVNNLLTMMKWYENDCDDDFDYEIPKDRMMPSLACRVVLKNSKPDPNHQAQGQYLFDDKCFVWIDVMFVPW